MNDFVLTANDDDSILAGKLFIHKHGNCTHLSANRKSRDLPDSSDLFFIRPYLKVGSFVGTYGYSNKFNVTIMHYVDSELYEQRDELTKNGCKCIWIDPEESFSTHMWEYLHGNKEFPDVVRYTHDYMKWELMFDESTPFHYGLSIWDHKLTSETTKVYIDLISGDETQMNMVMQDGLEIYAYVTRTQDFLSRELIFESTMDNQSAICANLPGVNSTFFSHRMNETDFDLAVVFGMNCPTGKVRHTLYKIAPEIDVQVIAKAHGGNGGVGVSGFVQDTLATGHEQCKIGSFDYTELLEPESSSRAVVEFIRLNHLVKRYEPLSAVYKGRKAFIANNAYLPREPLFNVVNKYDEEIGVAFCMMADHNYRISVINIDGTDAGEEFGELVGPYRISISPLLDGLESKTISTEVF